MNPFEQIMKKYFTKDKDGTMTEITLEISNLNIVEEKPENEDWEIPCFMNKREENESTNTI